MPAHDQPRFRITVWPGEALPLPDAWPTQTRLTEGHLLALDESDAEVLLKAEPRPYHEAYLRLVDLDLGDDEAILAWSQRYGPLVGGAWRGAQREWWRHPGFTDHPGFHRLVRPRLEEAHVLASGYGAPDWGSETVEEFRWAASCLRDLLRAWRFYSEGIEPDRWECPAWEYRGPLDPEDAFSAEAWELDVAGWEYDIERYDLDAPVNAPETREEAGQLLAAYLGKGLDSFHPRVFPVDRDHAPYRSPVFFYSICCLELFNHITEHATYKTCANETCGHTFVRQTGRAQHGQHRTSAVKYCSADCARAQAQREHRRRKKHTESPASP